MTQLVRTQKKVGSTVGKNLYHLKEFLNHHKQTIGRNMDIKGTASKGSEGNEEHIIGNLKRTLII